MRIYFLFILILLVLTNSAFAGYTYSRAITVQSGQISGGANLTQFPILVCGNAASGSCNTAVSNMATVANGGHIQNTTTVNGQTVPADLIFTTDSGCSNKLTWEVESYKATTGEFEAWVTNTSTPLAYNTNTTFYMCYGNAAVTTYQSSASAVWDSYYVGVWHLSNGTTLSGINTITGASGTLQNGPTAATGQIDGAGGFTGNSNQRIDNANIGNLSNGTPLTVSAWINYTTDNRVEYVFVGQNAANNSATALLWMPGTAGGVSNTYGMTYGTAYKYSSADLSTGTWTYIVGTEDGSGTSAGMALYRNAQVETYFQINTPGSPGESGGTAVIGGRTYDNARNFDGSIEEVRVSTIVRSAGWIQTEYNNQSAPTSFYTMGSETSGGVAATHFSTIGGNSTIAGNSVIN